MAVNWELDFYSRPILDEQEKKLWEVLICDSHRTFEYTKFCQGSQANARWLSTALEEALGYWKESTQSPESNPEQIRYFRRPMSTIISRACDALSLKSLPSRRTFAMYEWLEERYQSFYPNQPGYQPLMPAPPTFEPATPQPLPENLMGDSWRFVTLQKQDLVDMKDWSITFKDQVPLALQALPDEAIIPGLVIYSKRAIPLAGWMAGLELAAIAYESMSNQQLILETGISERWIIARMNAPELKQEAESFESMKQTAEQIHFLAIQSETESEEFAGFWVLQALLLA